MKGNVTHSKPAPAARVGRERTCTQCGATYRSPRNSSLYCSPRCRKRAHRGTAPTGGPRAGPSGYSIISSVLLRCGYVGRIAPSVERGTEPPTYGLLVDRQAAFGEIAYQFDRRGWGILTRAEFDAALRADGIKDFSTRSPAAADQKRWRDRQGQRLKRAS